MANTEDFRGKRTGRCDVLALEGLNDLELIIVHVVIADEPRLVLGDVAEEHWELYNGF